MTTRNPNRMKGRERSIALAQARRMKYRATDLSIFGVTE